MNRIAFLNPILGLSQTGFFDIMKLQHMGLKKLLMES